MSLATTLMGLGIPAEPATRIGYSEQVPVDGMGAVQVGAAPILKFNTNIACGTGVGDTAFILPADAELMQPYFVLNTTPDAALIYPPVGDTIDEGAVNAPVSVAQDFARVFQRVEDGRWVSFQSGFDTLVVQSIVAGTGIAVDNTDPENPVISNTGVLSVTPGTGIANSGTAQNPIIENAGVLSVSAGTNVSITGTAQNPIINSSNPGGTVTAVSVATANGFAGNSSGGATPELTLSTTVTGILVGNGTAVSAAGTTGTGDIVLEDSPTIETPSIVGTNGAQAPLSASLTDTSSAVGNAAKMWNPTFFGNPGTAVVHKFNRVMVGEATVGSTDLPMSTPDWLETLISASTQYSQFISVSATGNLGVSGASRTSDYRTWTGGASGGSQGVNGFAYNNDTGGGNPIATGVFGMALHETGVTGGITEAAEITICSASTPIGVTPYGGIVAGSTIGLNVTAGVAGYTNNVSVGLNVGSSVTAKFLAAINIEDDGLVTTQGNGGNGVAMQMARGSTVRWQNSGLTYDAELWGSSAGFHVRAGAQIITRADDGASAGPYLVLDRLSASPAASDLLGSVLYRGKDSAGNDQTYAEIYAEIVDTTSGSEDGVLSVNPTVAGTPVYGLRVYDGVVIGNPSSGFKGAGQLNATAYHVVAGTATVAPLNFTAGTNLTSATAGTVEYDGTAFYATSVASSRQVVATKQGAWATAVVALTNNITTAQSIFQAANDTLTLAASTTYRFRARLGFNTGATTHTTAFGFGGTATFTSVDYISQATSSAANTLATPQMRRVATAAASVLTATSTAVTTDIWIEGIVRVNGAGTVIPQVTFSAGPTGTCETAVNSFIELEPIGSNTVAAVGNWA